MGTVAAGVSSEALDAFFVHIPGTGGSTVTTALQYYACCHGLSRCPIDRASCVAQVGGQLTPLPFFCGELRLFGIY